MYNIIAVGSSLVMIVDGNVLKYIIKYNILTTHSSDWNKLDAP